MHGLEYYLPYLIALCLVAAVATVYIVIQRKRSRVTQLKWQEVQAAGLTEPVSLHPVIDHAICFGAATCVAACPEKALGVIGKKAILVNPSVCIGHGACASACPSGAIRLVFGTEKRGVDIPEVNPNFETNVPGLFIAGELGGMGLIRKAVEQGKQAIASITKRGAAGGADFDVIIVGAGPAGIAATLAAQKAGLRYLTLEQEESEGGTALHYPRKKIVMTAPMELPLFGRIDVHEISKEDLIALWHKVLEDTGIRISFNQRMSSVRREGGSFVVVTQHGQYSAGNVLLAIGRRGTPRKLGVPGEEHKKVIYSLIDPGQYRGNHVLVVGGGDSALEAALSLADEPDTRVTLSYRSSAFSKVKPKNRDLVQQAEKNGRITILMPSNVMRIENDHILLECDKQPVKIPNDAVIVCAGGALPMPLLKEIGVRVETHYGA